VVAHLQIICMSHYIEWDVKPYTLTHSLTSNEYRERVHAAKQ